MKQFLSYIFSLVSVPSHRNEFLDFDHGVCDQTRKDKQKNRLKKTTKI